MLDKYFLSCHTKQHGIYLLNFFREFLINNNVTFNDNGTVTYMPRRSILFNSAMSVGDPKKDFIQVPNVPMLVSKNSLDFFLLTVIILCDVS